MLDDQLCGQNQWVAYTAAVVGQTVEVGSRFVIAPAENSGLGEWNFAGRLDDQFDRDLQTIYVDESSVLHVGEQRLPGMFQRARR